MRGLVVALRVLGAVALVAACSSQPTPTPSASPTPSAPSYADTITVALLTQNAAGGPMEFSNATTGFDVQGALIDRFLYRALYRYDAQFAPVPDLADKPCEVAADQMTITCALANAQFDNGDPITADDVVFTYQLAMSGICPFGDNYPYCQTQTLKAVVALDPKTVRFTLKQPDAPFFTSVLPQIKIDSKRQISDAYDRFVATAKPIGADAFGSASDVLDTALNKSPSDSDCHALIGDAAALIARGGLVPPSQALWEAEAGKDFDACSYVGYLRQMLGDAHDALGFSGIDAVAAIYRSLSPETPRPVGSGHWAVKTFDPGKTLTIETAPGSSTPTRRMVFRFFSDRRQALTEEEKGAVDWVTVPGFQGPAQGSADLVAFSRQDQGLQLAHYALPGAVTEVYYNVRPGEPMADKDIRKAVDSCIDKPAIVEAATDGLADPAWSDVPPGTWAVAADLPHFGRDVDQANSLIKQVGWSMGADGYYHRNGQRLGITVLVGRAQTYRHRFLELASIQLRDCGFELKLEPQTQGGPNGINAALCSWPLAFPGDGHPFDAVMFTTISNPDPWQQGDFDGTAIITKGNDCFSGAFTNSSGYQNDEFDHLLAQVRTTYDLAQRTEMYKRMQEILGPEDHAALFAWFNTQYDVLAPGLTTTNGPIDLSSAGWDAQLETIVKRATPSG